MDSILALPGPATIPWGAALIQIYNDAYVTVAEDRHPERRGRPAARAWPDAYDAVIVPSMNSARAGRATRLDGFPIAVRGSDGLPQERLFDTDWSPIRDEAGAVAGALRTLVEVSDRHLERHPIRLDHRRPGLRRRDSGGMRLT